MLYFQNQKHAIKKRQLQKSGLHSKEILYFALCFIYKLIQSDIRWKKWKIFAKTVVKEYDNQKIVNTIGVNSKNNLTYSNNNCQMETFPRLSCSQVLSTMSSGVRGE